MSAGVLQRTKTPYATIRKGNRKKVVSFWAKGSRLFIALSTGFLLTVFAFAYVWINHQAIQVGYMITSENQRHLALIDLNRKLKVELANLTSLDRLERLAKDKLGLAAPRPDQVVVLE
ncbi:MAG: cell division protein FtsL [Deltaproteobacteria bacterium]|nr:cell division protein FtsL [Deltaproteobacteria bacterium]